MHQRHIKMGDGRMAWCGAPLKPTDRVFADLDEAEGRLTNPAARVIPCEKCWHNIHVMAANQRALAQAGGKRHLRSVGELIAGELHDPEFAQHYAQAQAGAGSEGGEAL